MLLATTCPACGAVGPAPCPGCRSATRPAPALPPPPGVDRCVALLAYEGVGREVVARLKYRNARSALPWLATGMAALVAGDEVDAVTWVPTTAARRRARGFDQGRLLARAVARRLGVPCRPLLRRLPGPPQTGASRAERLRGPRLVARRPPPRRVLLVDDVVTTGATLAAAARALRAAGDVRVTAVAAARRRNRAEDPREGGEAACVD
jgi:predicted amidophosphoribosyltransferase